jgi:uncharacterized protein (TIGR02597 family)
MSKRNIVMKTLLALPALLLATAATAVTTSYSPPVGGMTFTVNAGTPAAPVASSFSIPLHDIAGASGATVGAIASFTTTTLTVTNAGWTDGALATVQYPYAVRITSGTAAGYTYSITANTTDTLTIAGADPSAIGVLAGDSYRLIPIDTLNTLFGAGTFLGGASAAAADIVTLSSNAQLSYYYNTTLSRWVRTTGPTTDRGNIAIPLDSAITVSRKSTAMTLRFLGAVPRERFVIVVPNAGSTYTNTGFPTDVTLGTLALQSLVPGWVSSATAANADTLSVSTGGGFLNYFYNGTNWQRTTGPATNRDSINIPAGTPILIFKRGAASGTSLLARTRPYTI